MFKQKKKSSTKDLVHGDPMEPVGADGNTNKKEKKKKEPKEKVPSRGLLQNKALWGVLCLVAGLLIAFVGGPAAQRRAAALTPVVVLSIDAAVGTQLTTDMLKVVEMGAGGVPKSAVTNIADAAGKYLTTAGLTDDILTTIRLSNEYPTDDPMLVSLPVGKVAMAVALDTLEQSVASKLRAGDVIQLFAVLPPAPDTADNLEAMVIPELQAVEVLSVTNNAAANITDQDKSDEDRQISTVVLAVNQRQAAVLAGLTSEARLHSALVVRGNETGKAALLTAQEEYFEKLEQLEEELDQAEDDNQIEDNENQEGEEEE